MFSIMISQKFFIYLFCLLLLLNSVCNAQVCRSEVANVNPKNVYLTHYVGTEEIKYDLTTAATEIPKSSKFVKTLPIVIVTHGYLPGALNLNVDIVKAIEKTKQVNVFYLDYSNYAFSLYDQSVADAKKIGEHFGNCLSLLKDNGALAFHLIGHSLGAHLCGFAGKQYKKLRSSLLERITGLDCAGLCFIDAIPDNRLDFSDAKFVDIIHTDKEFGMMKEIGHADFYPNGGDNMPGLDIDHIIAQKYFAESINRNVGKEFISVSCKDWETFKTGACKSNSQTLMGYWTPNSARGNYFLKTRGSSLYGLGSVGTVY